MTDVISSKPTPRTRLALFGVTLALLVAWLVFGWGYIEDDGFIHLEYAKNLIDGHFAFDGRAVYADSSPMWVFGLTALGLLQIPLTIAAKVMSIAALGALLSGAHALARRWCAGHAWLPAAAVLLLALNPFVLHWAFAGMEAVAGAAVATWLLWCVSSPPRPRRLTLLLAGLAPLVRYELAFLSIMIVSDMAWRARAESTAAALRVLALGALAALPVAAWSAYTYLALGSLLPTTGPAKHIFQESLLDNALKVGATLLLGFAIPTLFVIAAAVRQRLRPRAAASAAPPEPAAEPSGKRVPWMAWAWPMLVLGYYALAGIAMQTRYALAPGVVVTLLAVHVAARWGWRRGPVVLVVATAASFVAVSAWMVVPSVENRIAVVALTTELDDAIIARVPADRPIAVYGIGQHAFELPHRIVDTGGLTIPSLLEHRASLADTRAWAVQQGAACFIDGEPPPDGYTVIASGPMPVVGWHLQRWRYATAGARSIYCRASSSDVP